MELTRKQFKSLIDLSVNTGKLEELKRFEGQISSTAYRRRKEQLREKIEASLDVLEEGKRSSRLADENLKVRVTVNGTDVKTSNEKKSFSSKLKEIFGLKVEEEEDDDSFSIVRGIILDSGLEESEVIGKIVTEL